MKKSIFLALLTGAFMFVAQSIFAQADEEPSEEIIDGECGGYEPTAEYHFITDVDGLRLRQRPSLDAPVKTILPKNTRLIWHGNDCQSAEFEVTFNDGVLRKGKWCLVTLWGDGESGWVFSGALALSYVRIEAEFDGGLDFDPRGFLNIIQLDSSQFAHRLSESGTKTDKPGSSLLVSPDALYGVRQLGVKDQMAGLEFVIFQKNGRHKKITIEDPLGGKARVIAWAKEPGRILVKWWDAVDETLYYDIEMPLPIRPY